MRTGKAYIRGYSFQRLPLPQSIDARSLIAYRKKNMPPTTQGMELEYTKIIRDAVGTFIGVTKASKNLKQKVVITNKDQRQEMRKVATAACRILDAQTPQRQKQWKRKLVCLIDVWQNDKRVPCVSLNTRDLLHCRLRRFDGDISRLVSHLHGDIDDPHVVPMLEVIAADEKQFKSMLKARYPDPDILDIVTRSTAIKKSKFHDQFLLELVRTLAPIWQEATGRTLDLRSTDQANSVKTSDFWAWLSTLIKDAGGTPPPRGSVVGIVRHLKISKINTRHN
jgi:hypothetical protein